MIAPVMLGVRKSYIGALAVALVVGCGGDGRLFPAVFPPVGSYANTDAALPTDNRGATAGQALVLFCHRIAGPEGNVDLTLEFGIPAFTQITTGTGSCTFGMYGAPAPCVPVPAGSYPGRLREGWKVHSQGEFRMEAGARYLISAHFGPKPPYDLIPVIDNTYGNGRYTCQGYDDPRADGGSSR